MPIELNVLNKIINNGYTFGTPSTNVKFSNDVLSINLSLINNYDNVLGTADYIFQVKYNEIVISSKEMDKSNFKRDQDLTADLRVKEVLKSVQKQYKDLVNKNLKFEQISTSENITLMNRVDGVRNYYYYIRIYKFKISDSMVRKRKRTLK